MEVLEVGRLTHMGKRLVVIRSHGTNDTATRQGRETGVIPMQPGKPGKCRV